MAKLTKRHVESIAPNTKERILWDDELSGFGLRVYPTGRKVYVVQYKLHGRTRRKNLGKHGVVTADEARREAKLCQADVARGADPSAERKSRLRSPSIKELGERFLSEHVALHCKPTTHYDYTNLLKNVVNPVLGGIKASEITFADIQAFHLKRRETPYQANRGVMVLSKMLNLAEDWGLRPMNTNPTRRVKRYPEEEKKRYLDEDEQERLGGVLADMLAQGEISRYVFAAFYLLLLTGCRLGEIQKLKWDYVTRTHLELPDSKTGRRRIPLPPPARRLLDSLEQREGNPYVILGTHGSGHYNDLQKPWRKIRAVAGLDDVRLHDLRHTYASVAVMNGIDPFMLKEILGHKNLSTTLRYAHLSDDAVQKAAGKIANRLAGALGNMA
ncbi:Site-specific recombinase XerD [Cognatiyoonia koreensis]|uniref:Site-specific recombinase XerD n=1 Tax=Cognatiyoonia koreensis TaxID=364200 RepID=A0A1I0PZA3_9RHOB|nr:site-specific integrase [Cognatiyoonia koreensis]SEW19795.1 Site-specific recombinase XerD [Cognatiyoonia koreensis]